LRYFLLFLFVSSLWLNAFSQSDKGRLQIRSIIFEGNKKTKERIIRRELSFKEGELYAKSEFDSLFVWNQKRIYNTNLFNTVELTLVNETEKETDVKISMDERWYFYPAPIFKLIDRNFNDWWVNRNRDLSRVNYGIRFSKFNFRGRRELLRVILQSGFTSAVNVEYSIPNIDKKQNQGLFFDLGYFEAKNVAYTTVRNIPRFTSDTENDLRRVFLNIVGHRYRSSFYTFHSTTLGHYHIQIADTLAQLNPNYLGDGRTLQRYFYFGHSFRYDKRNNNNYSTEGTRVSLGIFKHGLGIHNDGVNYWRIGFKAAKYTNLKNKWYAANDVSVLSTFPQRRDYFNYYKIGIIPETLRGYDLQQIEGSTYVIQRNELKYQLLGKNYDISSFMPIRQFQTFPLNIFWKVYFDHGYARGYPDYNGSEPLTDSYLFSFGTGPDFVIVNDLTLRLELSRNAQKQNYFFINFIALI